jgi:hypothetical protein
MSVRVCKICGITAEEAAANPDDERLAFGECEFEEVAAQPSTNEAAK